MKHLIPIYIFSLLGWDALASTGGKAVCDTLFGPTLNREITEYLKSPTRSPLALQLAARICLSSPSAEAPCPISVGGERGGQLSNAAKKVGATIVPMAICLSGHATGAVKEDLNEFVADLVDRSGGTFFRAYYSLNEKARQGGAQYSDYMGLVSNTADNYAKKARVLQKRAEMLQNTVMPEHEEGLKEALQVVQEALSEAQAYLDAQKSDGRTGLTFSQSRFDDEIGQRLVRVKVNDAVGISEIAEKLRQDLGLSYVVEQKQISPTLWTLCGSGGPSTCKPVAVHAGTFNGPCNTQQNFVTVKKSNNSTWWVSTDSNVIYQLNPKANFASIGLPVELRDKLGKVVNRWIVPSAAYKLLAISKDLRKVYFSKSVTSPMKTKLGDITLEISDTGATRFVGLKKSEQDGNPSIDKYIFLQPVVGEQGIPGSKEEYKLHVAAECR